MVPVGCSSSSRNSAWTRNKSKYKLVTLHNLVQAVQIAHGAVWRQSKCAILLIYRDMSRAASIKCKSMQFRQRLKRRTRTVGDNFTIRMVMIPAVMMTVIVLKTMKKGRTGGIMMISLILSRFFTSFYCFCGRLKKARCNLAKNWPILIQEPLRSKDWIHLKCFSIISYGQ